MKKKIIKGIRWHIKRLFNITEKVPTLYKYIPNGEAKVTHISAFSYGNAGDTFLPVVLRDLFNQLIGVKKWMDKDVHDLVTTQDISIFNRSNFIVIGGGGLFLSDTCPNDISGWQWNCDLKHLAAIKKPIIAFAIGYNRFRGQEEFKPIFWDHLNLFVEKCAFVGIRNNGSIEKLKPYLRTQQLKEKLVFQPCMTTLTAKIYPDLVDYTSKEDFIALNCAFDRKSLRSSDTNYLESIARVMLKLSDITKIKVYSHMPGDKEILLYLDRFKVSYELVELKYVNDILRLYSIPRLVVGMRGHAQMIPFGCQTAIISIISHDKMQWFLDDIEHPDWGADVNDPLFEQKLYERSLEAYNNYKQHISEIKSAQEKLWAITQTNLNNIKQITRQ